MAEKNFLVVTNAQEGKDEAFNIWYDNEHVPDVLDVPGVVSAQRYELAGMKIPEGDDLPAQLPPPTHRYLVIYELDRAPDEVMQESSSACRCPRATSTVSTTTTRPLQLRHAAGVRQVDNAQLALVTAGAGPFGGANIYSREKP